MRKTRLETPTTDSAKILLVGMADRTPIGTGFHARTRLSDHFPPARTAGRRVPGTCSAYCRGQSEVACVAVAQHRAVRWWLAAVGVLSVGLGGLGVIVPGLPTTVFLIIASWCFVRSCPLLERVLIRNRFFAPFLKYTQPGAVMPLKARVISTGAMWAAIGLSRLDARRAWNAGLRARDHRGCRVSSARCSSGASLGRRPGRRTASARRRSRRPHAADASRASITCERVTP
jgi:uncharacterized membrane protein YbaN (DUF454 family)